MIKTELFFAHVSVVAENGRLERVMLRSSYAIPSLVPEFYNLPVRFRTHYITESPRIPVQEEAAPLRMLI